MTPALLTRLRSWIDANPDAFECCLSVGEVREIVGALEKTRADVIEECARIADIAAWSNENTAFLGPEQNCVRIAEGIRALAQAKAASIEVIEVE